MDRRSRRRVATLTHDALIPAGPGVYAFYLDGERAYVGKAGSLRGRLWGCHLRKGVSMTNSALRRNVADRLGIASSADIKARRYLPSVEDANRVTAFVGDMEVAWIECEAEPEARALEDRLKREFLPPLTKQ